MNTLPEPLLLPLPGLLPCIQPDQRNPDGKFYFIKGWSHSGAAYGQHVTREEWNADLAGQAGPGELVEIEGVFYYQLTHASS